MTGPSSAWHRELADEPALIVVAEWVGILSARSGASPEQFELVPGGHAHAQRPGAESTACGRASAGLEPFRIDFRVCHDAWQCPECIRRLGEVQ